MSARRKVIWYIQHYAGGPGIGRYHRGYHLGKKWLAYGWDVHVIAAENHHLMDPSESVRTNVSVDGVNYHFMQVPPYRGNGLSRLLNMLQFGRSLPNLRRDYTIPHPSVIIYSSPHLFGVPAVNRLCTDLAVPQIAELRDLWPLSLYELVGMKRASPMAAYLGWLERRWYKRADAIVSLLPNTRSHCEERGGDPAQWYYIPNGVSLEEVAEPAAIDKNLSANLHEAKAGGKRILAYAGGIGKPNACECIFAAAEKLDNEAKESLVLVMVGDGTEKERLKEVGENIGVEVLWSPQVPKAQIWTIFSLVDAGVIVWHRKKLYEYGISANKIYDYMLAKLPIIHAVTASNDPVAESQCGWSVEAENPSKLEESIRDFIFAPSGLLKEKGERGYDWVLENHEYGKLAANYLDVVEGVTSP